MRRVLDDPDVGGLAEGMERGRARVDGDRVDATHGSREVLLEADGARSSRKPAGVQCRYNLFALGVANGGTKEGNVEHLRTPLFESGGQPEMNGTDEWYG